MTTRRTFLQACGAAGAAAALPARGADAPLELARIFVGFPPGTAADVAARKVSERLHKGYAKTVVIENRPGAGGQLAIAAMRGAPIDGSHLLSVPISTLGTYPHTYKKLLYDTFADLTPVSNGSRFDYGLGVGPAVPESVKTVPELMAWFKANPSRAAIGSPGAGSALHFIVIMLGRAAGVEVNHVAYRGSPPAIQDMMGGNLAALCTPLGAFLNQPRLRLLASCGPTRSRFTPNVPTLAEQGYKDQVYEDGFAFFLPGRTPPEVVRRLNTALRETLSDPAMAEAMAGFGLEPAPTSPEQLAATLQSELQRWGPIVKSIGFSADN
ncbi:tripartite tricarboxylate transporter substrate-binding protein [Aquabacterium sp. J223]|uniref:tripartite tricarboxylate transporter substrate-binding protein n=1 Tax=Aquabacterium sp. J223 TaxID=2898431 RepID=UPI0021AD5AB2|nr:tripartite tricarboxylate transporter substrate-binding protein [Aquabacterium sp. J223]UUX97554.1 twin-arginine translocation signal domain-containing protein [Aquabacterium sp. J223]